MGKCYTYQNILTIDDTNLCLTDTGDKKGRIGTPRGKDHTYQYNECMCASPVCAMGEVSPSWDGGKGLPRVEGWGVL